MSRKTFASQKPVKSSYKHGKIRSKGKRSHEILSWKVLIPINSFIKLKPAVVCRVSDTSMITLYDII